VGERVNRIEREFILRSVVEKKLPVTVRRGSDRVEALVEEVDDKSLVIAPVRPVEWRPGETVEVSFAFQNNNHTCTSVLTGAEGGRFRLQMPENLYKSLQRQFERVRKPAGFDVSFRIAGIGAIDLTFPLSGAPAEEPQPDAAFDPAAIKDLVDEFTERARTEASWGRIVMMRNRVSGTYEERIIQATGKAFWIPSTEEDFPSRDPLPEPRVLTKSEIVRHEKSSGTDTALIVSRLADMLYRKRREGIESELYWPLLRQRYFIGYLHMATHGGKKRIGARLLEWVGQFARILGYSLERSGYFKSEGSQPRPYQAEAVDLSASGLLFAHPEKDLYKKLLVHSDIQVALNAHNRRMTVGGRVVRKFTDRDRVYIALRFLELLPEDFRYLHETLYGRAFDPENVVSETTPPAGPTGG